VIGPVFGAGSQMSALGRPPQALGLGLIAGHNLSGISS
jgi:hypothetical protein